MNYITVEQFLEQSEKVQKVLRDWAGNNLQEYDLVKPLDEDNIYIINEIRDTEKDDVNVGRVFYLGNSPCFDTVYELIPLLSETQLRRFIEDKMHHKVSLDYYENRNKKEYRIDFWDFKKEESIKTYDNLSDDLLQAYWQVACKIAKGAKNDATES
jgi:hypothetical protein